MRSAVYYDKLLTELIEEALKEPKLDFQKAREIIEKRLAPISQRELLTHLLLRWTSFLSE